MLRHTHARLNVCKSRLRVGRILTFLRFQCVAVEDCLLRSVKIYLQNRDERWTVDKLSVYCDTTTVVSPKLS